VGVCTYEPEICASEVEAAEPPPPPPPQDCYAGADPECSPPSPPDWLKDDQYEADKPAETTNPKNISASDTITGRAESSEEYLQLHDAEVKNLEQELASENSGADTGNGSGDDSLTRDAGDRAGKPATPEPSGPDTGNPASGGKGAGEGGSGGGNPPATTPEPPEPPDEPASTPRFSVGSDGSVVENVEPTKIYGPGQSYDAQQAYENLGITKPSVTGQPAPEAPSDAAEGRITVNANGQYGSPQYGNEAKVGVPDNPGVTVTGAVNPADAPTGLSIGQKIFFSAGLITSGIFSDYRPLWKFLQWLIKQKYIIP
jgi:hypothetical protein